MFTFLLIAVSMLLFATLAWAVVVPVVPSRARITIRGGRTLDVPSGQHLLEALGGHGIRLPSTCGGKGSCARCRCRVLRGGGRITDRELPFFTRTEVRDHWRLACQVRVGDDLEVELPPLVAYSSDQAPG